MQWFFFPKIVAVSLASIFIFSDIGDSQAQSSSKCSSRYNLAWEMPLRSSDIGKPIGSVFGRSEFSPVVDARGKHSRVKVSWGPDNKLALEIADGKGKNDPFAAFLAPLGSKGVDAACLSLKIYVPSSFEWPSQGGKLPFGLWGGSEKANAGGTWPVDQKGWTHRNVISASGLRAYSYHLNRPGQSGQQGGNVGKLAWGRWQTVELEVVMNDVGKSNGYAQLWLDNTRRTMTNLRFRDSSSWAIRGLHFNSMWRSTAITPRAQSMYFADYKLYTQGGSSSGNSGSSSDSSNNDSGSSSNSSNNNSGSSSDSSPQSDSGSASSSGFGPVSPSGSGVSGNKLTVTWNPAAGVDRYYVLVMTDQKRWADRKQLFSGSATPSRNCNSNSCSLSFGNLLAGDYEWFVRTQTGSKKGSYKSLTFTVGGSSSTAQSSNNSGSSSNSSNNNSGSSSTSSPQSNSGSSSSGGSSFGPVSPKGNGVSGGGLAVTWNPASGVDRYYVLVMTDEQKWSDRKQLFGGNAYPDRHCNSNSCSLAVGNIPPGNYEWLVRTQTGSKKGSYKSMAFSVQR